MSAVPAGAVPAGVASASAGNSAGARAGGPRPAAYPVAIAGTSGTVTGADALVSGSGPATLTYAAGGTAATVVLDYGTEVGGRPFFDVTGVSGAPTLRATYSESRQYLAPGGDGAPGPGSNADPSRVDSYPLSHPGVVVSNLVQGGERFERLTLTKTGSVTISQVGVLPAHAPAADYSAGSFTSSDRELNQIWQLGVNTLALDSLPAGAAPPVWQVAAGGTEIPYSSTDYYQYGGGWGDYTETFSGQVARNELSWAVRTGLTFTLTADNDALNAPNSLLATVSRGFFAPPAVTRYPLPAGLVIKPGSWHAIATVASGKTVTVSVDGEEVHALSTTSTTGSVGFSNAEGATALVRNLSVVSPAGQALYRSPMTSRQAISDFGAGANPESEIIDGGKRDRLVWGGDLLQSAPTAYYTSDSPDAVRGSLELLGSYRTPAGEVSSADPVGSAPGTRPVTALSGSGGFYSLVYSADWLLNVYQYYLYTGDQGFLHEEWPAILAELGYLKSNAAGAGLVKTTAADGMDWALDDQTGAVTAYNAVYYEGLLDMSKVAAALGQPADTRLWAQRAATVKAAVNATLFDAKTGVYDVSTSLRGTYAQDANSLAVLFGIAPRSKAASILTTMNARLATANGPQGFSNGTGLTAVISPFMSAFDVDAELSVGQSAGALSLIRALWGRMVPGRPFYSGGDWEALGLNGNPQLPTRTLAHAWGTGPTSALPEYILGVQPTAPGYASYLVAPQIGDLASAKGTVPTPFGTISVSWVKRDGSLLLQVTVPHGATGAVVLPRATGSRLVILAGQPAGVTRTASGFRVAITAGGSYSFSVTE